MKISFRNWNDEANFLLAFSFIHDRKGRCGAFLELFGKRIDFSFRPDLGYAINDGR